MIPTFSSFYFLLKRYDSDLICILSFFFLFFSFFCYSLYQTHSKKTHLFFIFFLIFHPPNICKRMWNIYIIRTFALVRVKISFYFNIRTYFSILHNKFSKTLIKLFLLLFQIISMWVKKVLKIYLHMDGKSIHINSCKKLCLF